VSLRVRIAEYLRKYPSVGLLRLALDLAPAGLAPGSEGWQRHVEEVKRSVRDLAERGLASFNEELGVVNYRPFLEKGWGYAGGEPPWRQPAAPTTTAVGPGEEKAEKLRERREARDLLVFLAGGGNGRG